MLDSTIPATMMNGTYTDNNIHEKGNRTSNNTLASWNEADVLLQPAAPFMKDHLSSQLLAWITYRLTFTFRLIYVTLAF